MSVISPQNVSVASCRGGEGRRGAALSADPAEERPSSEGAHCGAPEAVARPGPRPRHDRGCRYARHARHDRDCRYARYARYARHVCHARDTAGTTCSGPGMSASSSPGVSASSMNDDATGEKWLVTQE